MIWICSPNVDHHGLKWLEDLLKKCNCRECAPALYLLTTAIASKKDETVSALVHWAEAFKRPVFVRTEKEKAKEFVNANLGLFLRESEEQSPDGTLRGKTPYAVETAWSGSCNLTESGLGLQPSATSQQCDVVVTADDGEGINSIRDSFLWLWRREFSYDTMKIDCNSGKLVSVSGTAHRNLRKPA